MHDNDNEDLNNKIHDCVISVIASSAHKRARYCCATNCGQFERLIYVFLVQFPPVNQV